MRQLSRSRSNSVARGTGRTWVPGGGQPSIPGRPRAPARSPGAILDAELVEHVRDVVAHRLLREREVSGDLRVVAAAREELGGSRARGGSASGTRPRRASSGRTRRSLRSRDRTQVRRGAGCGCSFRAHQARARIDDARRLVANGARRSPRAWRTSVGLATRAKLGEASRS